MPDERIWTYSDAVAAYLNEELRRGRYGAFLDALGHLARAHGVTSVAEASGLGRESLYKALAAGAQPRFATVCKVMASLGLALAIEPPSTTRKPARAARKRRAR